MFCSETGGLIPDSRNLLACFYTRDQHDPMMTEGRTTSGRKGLRALVALLAVTVAVADANDEPVLVGVSKVDVTPTHPVVLAGYGGRTAEFEGVDAKLWARAMVIGERDPVAIVVLDNCGVPAAVKERVVNRLGDAGITPERLVVAVTHTHNAPSLMGYARILWAGRTTREQEERMERYTEFAAEKMAQAIMEALEKREPAYLSWAQGRATFGGNRRVLADGQWRGFGHQRDAPVDHSLPVLAARDEAGEVKVLWANYACHCTTVGGRNHVGGDWAGYANEAMEAAFPGATSLMSIGCGADIGPQPGGGLQVAKNHGEAIGLEVKRLLGGGMRKLGSAPSVSGKTVALPLADPKPRSYWEEMKTRGSFNGQLASSMLARLDAGGRIPAHVSYPVTSWKFGTDLAMVFLPGEVVVDYAVRLNRELAWPRLWLTAWANDMPGYIPSRRVLAEGGYEADFSQVYYDQPGRYKPEVEEVVIAAVREVVGEEFLAPAGQTPAPFHAQASLAEEAFRRLRGWASGKRSEEEVLFLDQVRVLASQAGEAVDVRTLKGGETTSWHNFAGDFTQRVFIRQQKKGAGLSWESPVSDSKNRGGARVCFTGGMGWETEPQTDGFLLLVNGEEKLRFDVTRKFTRWFSQDKTVELLYLPTWTSALDSGGFFFLSLPDESVTGKDTLSFSVRSLGEGSKRWFAVDARQETEKHLERLQRALAP